MFLEQIVLINSKDFYASPFLLSLVAPFIFSHIGRSAPAFPFHTTITLRHKTGEVSGRSNYAAELWLLISSYPPPQFGKPGARKPGCCEEGLLGVEAVFRLPGGAGRGQ